MLSVLTLMATFAFAAESPPEGADIDFVMIILAITGALGNLAGISASTLMFTRSFYWLAVGALAVCALGTVAFCPLIAWPPAVWSLIVLFRPEVRVAFGAGPAPFAQAV